MNIEFAVAQFSGNDATKGSDCLSVFNGKEQILSGSDLSENDLKLTSSSFAVVLADGGVAEEHAEECSQSSIGEFTSFIEKQESIETLDSHQAEGLVNEGMKRVNELLLQLSEVQDDGKPMVCSLGCVWAVDDYLAYHQIGNIRVYRFVDGVIEQLTDDQTEAWELVNAGKITPEKAMTYPGNRKLTKMLGGKKDASPAFNASGIKVEIGDVFIVCSDGISHFLPERELELLMAGAVDEESKQLSADISDKILSATLQKNENEPVSVAVFRVTKPLSRWGEMIREL